MKNLNLVADRFGILASSACAVHCVLIPVLLVAGTAVPAVFLDEEIFHVAILFLILPAAAIAFGIGCRQHKDTRVMLFGAVGLAGILSAIIFHEALGETGERLLTLVSSAILITAHVRNYRLCRSDSCDH